MPKQKAVKINFTNRAIEKLAPRAKSYRVWDTKQNGLYLLVSPTGTLTYYLSYSIPGTRERRDFKLGRHGILTHEQARKAARLHSGEVAKGIDIQAQRMSERQRAVSERYNTLGSFIEHRYQPWALQHKKRGKEDLRRVKHHFGQWFHLPLKEISVSRVSEWQTVQLKKERQASGINRDINALKSILSKAVEYEMIDESPLKRLKKLKQDKSKRVRYLSMDEESRLRSALDNYEQEIRERRARFNQWLKERHKKPRSYPDEVFVDHLKPMVLLALNTGMRIGELFNLCWSHIDWANNSLTIVGDLSKSGQTRHIPISDEALYILKNWRKASMQSLLVFPSPKTGKKLDNINSVWTSIRKSAGLFWPDDTGKHFRFHDLRHSFASNLVMAGVDLNTVRELLGHETIEMTLKYAHLAPEASAAAIAALNSRTLPPPGKDFVQAK
ncbi:MAG: tyrosine-type recombinase/integrase [Endozoicomonas sp.]|uniref:tyrosine-type recombinase/integrase n=1 Tax=Endozoicomonas sp. TaxID=1892382 RepID=UPI003D9B97C4